MPYLSVSDFKFGMDRRRPQYVGVPGTMWKVENGLVSRGGDIVRAKKFVSAYTLPAGTFGCYSLKGQLYVFGSGAEPSGMPAGVQYQRLQHPSTGSMIAVVDVKAFDGKAYVIAEYDDGSLYHFYNGTRVNSWDSLVTGSASDVAARLARKIAADSAVSARAFGAKILIEASVAGTAFTISGSATDGGADTSEDLTVTNQQANVAAVTEVRATGTIEITGGTLGPGVNRVENLTVGGSAIIESPVDWTSSNDATANALAVAINDYTGASGYSAEASGATVTITAAVGTGATANGDAVVLTPGGNLTASTTDMAGGVTEVAAVAQIELVEISGTIEIEDSFSVTINGTAYTTTALAAGMGTSLFVHKKRMWSPTGSIWRYCKLNDPTNWTDGTASTGAGFVNVSTDSEGAQELIGAAVYQGLAAVFARENIVLYQLDTDSANFAYSDTIANTGTAAAGSVVPYGNTDVFYLDDTGIRSIRSRDGTNAAYTSDVGSAIDPYVTDLIASVTESAAAAAEAIVDPVDGRYMLAVGETIVALSYFPDSKISAWSYLAQGYSIDDLVRSNRDIYLRSGDTIYRYGGADGATYPDAGEFETVAETAFMDARDPAARKLLQGFDMACEGEWLVEVLIDPNDTTKKVTVGRIDAVTYHKPAINLPEKTSHIAFRFTADKAGYASLSSLAVHFEGEEKG